MGRHPMLDTAMLVHETYERLLNAEKAQWRGPNHLFRTGRRVMKRVMLDWIRRKQCEKRGGAETPRSLHTIPVGRKPVLETVLSVRQSLSLLRATKRRMASVVGYKLDEGLTDAEIADALQVSVRTVRRDWAKARTMLQAALA
jgi:RNA polymerase sigma factor (TIGR02999 family)